MTLTYVASGNVWNQFGHPRKKRPLESVILNQGLSERVLTDIRDFIGSPEWYMNRGNCWSDPVFILYLIDIFLRDSIQKGLLTLRTTWMWKK